MEQVQSTEHLQRILCNSESRTIPLSWDWRVLRTELLFRKPLSLKSLFTEVDKVFAWEDYFASLTDQELSNSCKKQRKIFRCKAENPEDVQTALAAIREVMRRVRSEFPYKVQVAGAIGILRGCIMEMATGEGKTLTACMAGVIEGWKGLGCHVITSNDYLAIRDAEEMMGVYEFCGVSVGIVSQELESEARHAAYGADVTYLTGKEAAADFLRDRLALGSRRSTAKILARRILSGKTELDGVVQRGLPSAIIDEADSVLIDGGSMPLVISSGDSEAEGQTEILAASAFANTLLLGEDYLTNIKFRETRLTDAGREKMLLEVERSAEDWGSSHRAEELVLQALEAREFFKPTVQYLIIEEKIVIVDEGTGRLMPDHEWRDGMHQAVSAKEGLPVLAPKTTLAQSSFQDFFLRYSHLAGMTGTAIEARREFLQFYELPVMTLPPNRPCLRKCAGQDLFLSEEEKVYHIVEVILSCREKGQPVLVGTRSIGASQNLSEALSEAGIDHQVLNAVHSDVEADIIVEAGRSGQVTVATNMAGRGTDIKLGPDVSEAGGLHVILTDLHESARIDRQLLGRSSRQGDPGSYQYIISLEGGIFATAPHFCLTFVETAVTRLKFKKTGQKIGLILGKFFQKRAERKSFRARCNLVRSAKSENEQLSFAGRDF